MFSNKETEIACNKINRRNQAIKEFLAMNNTGKEILDIRLKETTGEHQYKRVSNVSLFDHPNKDIRLPL